MFYFQWQDSYLTHIDELDAQHQKLVALINGLYTDLMNCPEDAEKQACVFKGVADSGFKQSKTFH